MSSELQDFLHDENLDGFLVLTKINRQYLSGFTGSSGMFLITKKRMQLFVDGRYTLRAKKESAAVVKDIDKLALELKRQKIKKLAIEDKITLAQFGWLKVNLKGVKWEITKDIIENIRAVKTKEELKCISKGSRIIDQVFRHIAKFLKQKRGLRELDIALEIEKTGKKLGAEEMAFDPIVAFGPNAASPHHFPGKQKIGRNNFLLFDFGMKINGYHSDFTRTLFLGKPSNQQARVYNTVLAAQQKAIEKVRIGIKASEVDKAARGFIQKKKYGKYFTHNTGHGVGLEIHELPNFSEKSKDVLAENMIVTVEPGIYLPKKFGVRIEDMVLVSKKSRIISSLPKDLTSMIIP
ncbi:MAG: aminopeptidase P family protein [Candidatus Doudnabacteria bacterium]|nr:aminopeptidase P family protein [Candidatus Doudnabacteria bacterium]